MTPRTDYIGSGFSKKNYACVEELSLNMMKTWDTKRERETEYCGGKKATSLVTPETTWQGALESCLMKILAYYII